MSTAPRIATPNQMIRGECQSDGAGGVGRAGVVFRECGLARLLLTGFDCVTSLEPLPVDAELPHLVGDHAVSRAEKAGGEGAIAPSTFQGILEQVLFVGCHRI